MDYMRDPKPRNKKPDLDSRVGKYYLLRKTGAVKSKKEAALRAGYSDGSHITQIERSKTYEVLEQTFVKDELLKHISIKALTGELVKNIVQDDDRAAKNAAIKIAFDKIEPDGSLGENSGERVIVVLK